MTLGKGFKSTCIEKITECRLILGEWYRGIPIIHINGNLEVQDHLWFLGVSLLTLK